MAGKREHFAAQAQEFNPISIVPPHHLDNVAGICQSKAFNEFLSAPDISFLVFVRPVLRSMLGLRRVLEWMSVFDDRGNAAGSGAENRRS